MAYTNLQDMKTKIAAEENFTGSNTRGEKIVNGEAVYWTGRLPREWEEDLHASVVRYVVFSYSTPIAWVTADGEAVVPAVKYSVSTSKVQGYVAAALSREHGEIRCTPKVAA
jgi:hypothetical protein